MQVRARVATKGDVGTLAELYRAYRSELALERGGSVHTLKEAFGEPLEPYFSSLAKDERWVVLLGTLDKVPIGLAAARLDTLPDATCLAAIEVLYVDPAAREVGVGEQLLEAVVRWAARRDATGVEAKVLPGMRESKNFLEGSGFVARLLVMHLRLQR